MGEREKSFIQFDVHPFEIRNIESFIVLLYGGLYHDFLLLWVDFQQVSLFRVGEVSNSPLKTF